MSHDIAIHENTLARAECYGHFHWLGGGSATRGSQGCHSSILPARDNSLSAFEREEEYDHVVCCENIKWDIARIPTSRAVGEEQRE